MIAKVIEKLSPRERQGFVLALGFVLLAILYLGVANPLRNWFAEMDRKIEVEKKRAQRNQRVLAVRDVVQKDYREKEGFLKKKMSTDEERNDMVSTVVNLATQAGVTLGSTKQRDPRLGEIEEYAVDVEVEARLDRLEEFLYRLQESTQLLRVETLSLGPKGGADPNEVKGSLLITKVLTL